ncbi:MAG: CDP-alcohol phosphatidyltransferase family protein [Alphaproteobacteria bacterium GM202ARS2]|nr:CDP-alcohol phosphatidyltransferase family protein [Alphaproteobacteria bacterium GM202ARS2]
MVTMTGLWCGMAAILYAVESHWQTAVILLLIAALLDFFDGKIARLLGLDNAFGLELDSFADVISFGVAPALIIFLWALADVNLGWLWVMIYVSGVTLRLVNFNVTSDTSDQVFSLLPKGHYFKGLPAPLAALFCLLPMMVSFHYDTVISPYICISVLLACTLFMVTPLPFPSIKGMPLFIVLFLLVGMIVLLATPWFWLAVMIVLGSYIFWLPFSLLAFRRRILAVRKL